MACAEDKTLRAFGSDSKEETDAEALVRSVEVGDAVQGDSAQERTVRALMVPVLTVLIGLERAAAEEHSLPDGQVKTVEIASVTVTAPDVTTADAF